MSGRSFARMNRVAAATEPLHERIANLNLAAIKTDPDIRLSQTLRHPVPKTRFYFHRVHQAPPFRIAQLFPELAYDRYLLQPAQMDGQLRSYLEGLISSASAAKRRAVLCFCRSQMRSAWMKQIFGGVHVAQIRNPADQWASFKVDSYFVSNMIVIALSLRRSYPKAFTHIQPFESFAQQLSRRPLPAEESLWIISYRNL